MSGTLRLTILGCGSSGGVPRLGGDWGACDPANPKNWRTRCSLLVERKPEGASWNSEQVTTILVDTSPDMRAQLLAARVTRLDAVFLTHDHADQTHGIDDLRAFWMRQRQLVPVYMDQPTANVIMQRFGYCFAQPGGSPYPPILEARLALRHAEQVTIDGPGGAITVEPLDQDHGYVRSLGFRFGRAAYSNDVVELPDDTKARLKDLDLWIVDALQDAPHRTHAHVDKTLDWIEELAPKQAVLTNMHHSLDHDELAARTPSHVTPAHDGMTIEVDA
ncbi:MAG: MBL fold metallo-hydrolase [Maricaulaceae bacterium]|jgi:phosphoribosyl 1,2-cyclic phosphate phosphodiesterase